MEELDRLDNNNGLNNDTGLSVWSYSVN